MSTPRGAALLLVVLGIVCLGVLLAGLAFASREDYALSTAARSSQRAFTMAERSLWLAVAELDSSHLSWPVGEQRSVSVPSGSADSAGAAIRRIAPSLFVVSGEAGVSASGGTYLWRRAALFARASGDSLGVVTFHLLPGRSWAELPRR